MKRHNLYIMVHTQVTPRELQYLLSKSDQREAGEGAGGPERGEMNDGGEEGEKIGGAK